MDNKIKYIIVAVTNRCNLHCKMCTIWAEPEKWDLDHQTFKKIFDSKYLDDNFALTLTGGEPFLSKEFDNIIKTIISERPESLKTISTNGVLTNKILEFLEKYGSKLPNLSLSISLDGINTHDLQRGRSKEDILGTINLVRQKFPKMKIKIKFTITPINYKDIIPTYEFCRKMKVVFKVKISESAENYTNKLRTWNPTWSKEMKDSIRKDLMIVKKGFMKSDKAGANFVKRTIGLLDGKVHLKECRAPFERVFIMPDAKNSWFGSDGIWI